MESLYLNTKIRIVSGLDFLLLSSGNLKLETTLNIFLNTWPTVMGRLELRRGIVGPSH